MELTRTVPGRQQGMTPVATQWVKRATGRVGGVKFLLMERVRGESTRSASRDLFATPRLAPPSTQGPGTPCTHIHTLRHEKGKTVVAEGTQTLSRPTPESGTPLGRRGHTAARDVVSPTGPRVGPLGPPESVCHGSGL